MQGRLKFKGNDKCVLASFSSFRRNFRNLSLTLKVNPVTPEASQAAYWKYYPMTYCRYSLDIHFEEQKSSVYTLVGGGFPGPLIVTAALCLF